MILGILREGKIPHDKRVPFTPQQCARLHEQYADLRAGSPPFGPVPHRRSGDRGAKGLQIIVQPSPYRCFSDEEYRQAGIIVVKNISNCDFLMGIKEVPVNDLVKGKTYLFFSHTIKKQPHNQKLLQAIIKNKVRLVDYECLTYPNGFRVLGFGKFAGIAGVYNAIRGYGLLNKQFTLKPPHLCHDRIEMNNELKNLRLPPIKIVITGEGRVANGAKESFQVAGINQVTPDEFISKNFNEPVYCQLGVTHYNKRKDRKPVSDADFFMNPQDYESAFLPYTKVSDIFISCHFWDPKAPKLFSMDDLHRGDFKIKIIADISCDVNGSVPTTIRSTTIENPFFGIDRATGKEIDPFNPQGITVMAVDNLPCELPKDSSEDFGEQLIKNVMPNMLGTDKDDMINMATIAIDGALTPKFNYLQDYIQ